MSGLFFQNSGQGDCAGVQASRLSLMQVVFATLVGRNASRSDDEMRLAVSDVCSRDVGSQELLEIAQELVDRDVITSGPSLCRRLLTVNGTAVMREAESCIVRLIDNNSGLVILGAMIGLFDKSEKE